VSLRFFDRPLNTLLNPVVLASLLSGMTFLGSGCYQSPPSTPHVAIHILTGLLADADGQIRAAAAESLGKIGQAGAETYLITALKDADPTVREAAARALGRLSSVGMDAGKALLPLLQDPNSSVQQAAAQALGAIDDSAMRSSMAIDLLKDPRVAVRRSAAHALFLTDSSTSAIREALTQATKDADASVRQWAVAALGESGDPDLATTLVHRLLHDPSTEVQAEAAYRLRFTEGGSDLKELAVIRATARSVEVTRWLNHSLTALRTESESDSGHPPSRPAETGLSRQYP
jgi:HEAT repeat protein